MRDPQKTKRPAETTSELMLRHLRYVVALAEELNITKAATRLTVSQAPWRRQIRDLEEELGVVLLERTLKEVRLTSAERVFFRETRGAFATQPKRFASSGRSR